MMRAADEVIVVADSTKFGHQSLAHVCPLEAVHTWWSTTALAQRVAREGRRPRA